MMRGLAGSGLMGTFYSYAVVRILRDQALSTGNRTFLTIVIHVDVESS